MEVKTLLHLQMMNLRYLGPWIGKGYPKILRHTFMMLFGYVIKTIKLQKSRLKNIMRHILSGLMKNIGQLALII